ncbi:MAG TPA: hypothetical protein VFY88_06885, partial [Intrasporangium sp.]|nr:hypothetical protein [Intrasporangium sp.]
LRAVGLGRQQRALHGLPPARSVGMPKVLLDMLVVVYRSLRYRGAVLGIAAHRVQSVVFANLVLLLVPR